MAQIEKTPMSVRGIIAKWRMRCHCAIMKLGDYPGLCWRCTDAMVRDVEHAAQKLEDHLALRRRQMIAHRNLLARCLPLVPSLADEMEALHIGELRARRLEVDPSQEDSIDLHGPAEPWPVEQGPNPNDV